MAEAKTGIILQADDISVGMWVTGFKGEIVEERTHDSFLGGGVVTIPKHEDHSYQGDAMIVVAVNYPYIAVARKAYVEKYSTTHIDLRRFQMMRVTEEYARALWGDEYDAYVDAAKKASAHVQP